MRLSIRTSAFLLVAACGPSPASEPGDSDASASETTTTTGPAPGTTAEPEPSTGAPLPTTTTDAPDPSTSTSDDTTGAPVTCPKGQPPFTPQWATVIAPGFAPELHHVGYQRGIASMLDGRVAVTLVAQDDLTNKFAPAVLFLSPAGEPLSVHVGELLPGSGWVFGLLRDDDDSLLLTGSHSWIMGDDEVKVRWAERFGSDGSSLARAELVGMHSSQWLMGRLAAPILLGLDDEGPIELARLAPGGVEPASIEVVSVAGGRPGALASRGDGTGLAVYAAGPAEASQIVLRGLDADGALQWLQTLDRPDLPHVFGAVATPSGWAVMAGDDFAGTMRLLTVTAADGVVLGEAEFADPDPQGLPRSREMFWTGDHLTIPVLRQPEAFGLSEARTVAVHRVSLQGQTLDVTPLPGAATLLGGRSLQSALGRCGELLVMPMQNAATDAQLGEPLQISAWSP